jgi:hypothetical protein
LNAASEGTALLRISAPNAKSISVNDTVGCPATPDDARPIVVKLRSGSNDIAVQYGKASSDVPSLELEAAPAPIFVEAEDGKLTPPMHKQARKDAAGGAVIAIPFGSGRGEKGGKAIDNGYATYEITIPKDGKYRLNARVFWRNGDKNSFYYAWDDGEPKLLGNDDVFGKWHWIQTEPKRLKAGAHTLRIRNREEDSVLDCMTVVPDKPGAK